ncbi:MAG TPA: hypothetical protein VGV13_00930 [Methylomirabilota bacterium]|jgi:hypothetical protein|nr:hypothetical protein [Methylomirabilota bacterium]
MGLLTRDAILAAPDLATERVQLPEWGGEVLVRGLTAQERDEFDLSCFEGAGRDRRANFANLRARLGARTIVDEAGARLFTDADVAALGGKSGAALDRIYEVAQRLSGLRPRDVEELVGNSRPGPSAASSSGSRSSSGG